MLDKIDLLAIGVHPDDVELSAGGTLLLHASMGHTFGILDLSAGELGTRGTPEIRHAEGLEAARILGAKFRHTLDIPDGYFEHHPDQWIKIVRVLRASRPEIVLINAPTDRHPDHGRAAALTLDACFYAGLERIQTMDESGGRQAPFRPKSVYHYIQDKHLSPDFVIDISPFYARKMEAILAFRSQFYHPDAQGPSTPISSEEFMRFMDAKMRVFGRSAQVEYAEGFINTRVPGVKSLFDIY